MVIHDSHTNWQISLGVLVALIPSCVFTAWQYSGLCFPLRSALACGLLLALSVDHFLDKSLTNTLYACLCLRSTPIITNENTFTCMFISVVGAALSFLTQLYTSGALEKSKKWNYAHLSETPSSEFKIMSRSQQKTFSYPDHLEFNYFDPDALPRHLQAHADIIFSSVQLLASEFGFQVDNSRNQAEHLLMMLSNECESGEHILTDTINRLHSKMFANYRTWCNRLGTPPLFAKREVGKSHVDRIEDILLQLLIWGEAANLRHVPEALCFVYHKIREIKQRREATRRYRHENLYPGYFLDYAITPIYEVIATALNKEGDHEVRKTYDDFNEFFWSPSCLQYNLMESDEDIQDMEDRSSDGQYDGENFVAQALARSRKTYLEKRSYMHAVLSFHRVLEWHTILFVLCTSYAFGELLVWTTAYTLQSMSVVFMIANFSNILWICLESWVLYPGSTVTNTAMSAYFLRLAFSYCILVLQGVYYYRSFDDRSNVGESEWSLHGDSDNAWWWWQYVWVSTLTLAPSMVQSIFCTWIPSLTSVVLAWQNDIIQTFLNIFYPFSTLFVGKKLHTSQWNTMQYALFWSTLLCWKIYFGYYFIVKPIAVPTVELYDDYMNFLNVSIVKTLILMCIWWLPHYLVFLIDLAIWFAVWSSFVGAFQALLQRMGAVREIEHLREHFMRAPHAFCQRVMPPSSSVGFRNARGPPSQGQITPIDSGGEQLKRREQKKTKSLPPQNRMSHLSTNDLAALREGTTVLEQEKTTESSMQTRIEGTDNRFAEFLDVRTQRWVVFSKVWNSFISSLRNADHISNAEQQTFKFDIFDWLSKPVYLPLFQTAGCVEKAVEAFVACARVYNSEREPQKKLLVWENFQRSTDVTTKEAISESWELTCWSLSNLYGGVHTQDVSALLIAISKWATSDDICSKIDAGCFDKIKNHLANIIGALKGCISKRAKNPLITPEVIKRKQTSQDSNSTVLNNPPTSASGGGIKKSVSTGFLAALNSIDTEGDKSKQEKQGSRFTKLQPFRARNTIVDNPRDKIRDETRNLFSAVKSALRKISSTEEGRNLLDRITFVMSVENGFLWDDVYASSQIDEFARNPMASTVLAKLYGLLKMRPSEVELKSAEASRRINFFVNSLFMEMPTAPSLRYAKEYTVITPFYSEDVLLTKADLEQTNEDGVSTFLYMKTLYQRDWQNFMERNKINDEEKKYDPKYIQETRIWASRRAQTLFRTVDGMMQSELAIRLLAELEQLSKSDTDVYAKLKFSYVVACQVYGKMKKNLEHKADDIDFLLKRYPNLRVAYIDSVRMSRDGVMSYYSVLIKGDGHHNDDPANENVKIKEVYRIKLPGNPVLGEGKPENQNHAIVFTRGRYLQAIDMNQDGYLEEALKMRNFLEEFNTGDSIVGFREHIFTGTVSSVANYMALQETSFVTLGQRVLTAPLNIRQHYGHPDMFDKIFIMTEGGMSKASKGINLSEDVFAGFNATIRGKSVGFKEYVHVGKGRDVGLQQTYKFEAKLAQGNAEQTLSRDMFRIGERLDFFRFMSFYYGGVGHYVANAMIMFTLMILVYFMTCLAIFNQEGVDGRPMTPEGPIQLLLAGMGLLMTLPLIMTLLVEKGVGFALREVGFMFLSGGPLYFIFQIQTKSYYFQQTILAGGAKYKATGRGFVTRHTPFDENYRYFASSHIYLGFELMIALCLFKHYSVTHQYIGLTWCLWLVVVSLLFGPFWFNPLSFEASKVCEDYTKWQMWMNESGGTPDQSWESWFNEESEYIKHMSISWRIFLIIIRCSLWAIVGVGILGPSFFNNPLRDEKFSAVFVTLFVLYAGNWAIEKLDRSLSYAVRRSASALITSFCVIMLAFLFHTHKRYFAYTMSFYYIGASLSLICLLTGLCRPSYFYKIHDYVIGHFLFVILYVLSVIQLGVLQTWLLYHNALDAGVAIEDILQYAKRKQDGEVDEAVVIELRNQLMEQDKLIKHLTELYVQGGDVTSSERTGLLTDSTGLSKTYGSSVSGDSMPMNVVAASIQPKGSAGTSEETPVMPKSAMKQESITSTTASKSDGDLSELVKDAAKRSDSKKKRLQKSADLSLDTKFSDGSFVFKQPNAPPPR